MDATLHINQTLISSEYATIALKDGCSVIPLDGKKPLLDFKWGIYQYHRPTQTQIDLWFTDEQVTGYGVICGKISGNLVVVDFDCPEKYKAFQEQFPDIVQTYTVKSQRGCHVYLRGESEIKTQHFGKVDVIGRGGYVVGAGSTNGEFTYVVVCDAAIQRISDKEVQHILNWLQGEVQKADGCHPTQQIKSSDLVRLYQQRAPKVGRNNALFQVSVIARNSGISQGQVQEQLLNIHAATKPFWKHQPETKAQRIKEGSATIQSAYARKQEKKQKEQGQQEQLPNNIREKLLQRSRSSLPGRVIEALHQQGFSGKAISMSEAIQAGKEFSIAPSSVRKVLHNHYINIIEKAFTPARNGDITNCKTTINKGRPPLKCYLVPTIESLCEKLGVTAQSTDEIGLESLRSAKAYRMALHQSFIQRTQPECSPTWHGQRLGVTGRTIQRYNKDLKIVRVPVIEYRPLNWENVDSPQHFGEQRKDGVTPGQWLQVDDRRYPAKKGIALDLLKQGRVGQVVSCSQKPNRYYLPEDTPQFDIIWRLVETVTKTANNHDTSPQVKRTNTKANKPIKPAEQGGAVYLLSEKQQRQAERLDVLWSSAPQDDLTMIHGIGHKRQAFLNALGIRTFYQLATVDAEALLKIEGWGVHVKLHTIKHWINAAHVEAYGHDLYSCTGSPLFASQQALWEKREKWILEMQEQVYDENKVDIKRLAFISKQDDNWRDRYGLTSRKNPLWYQRELQDIRDEFRRRGIPDEKFKALVDSV